MSNSVPVRDWMFRALMFELEAERFRKAGIRVGASVEVQRALELEAVLAPFPVALRARALRMTHLYATFYCFENSVRDLIVERLSQADKADWWAKLVPSKCREYAEKRKTEVEANSWLAGDTARLIDFLLFGQLADIIINNWGLFEDLIPNQHWLRQRFDELEKVRNFTAHHREISDADVGRVEMYINDWNRQVGF